MKQTKATHHRISKVRTSRVIPACLLSLLLAITFVSALTMNPVPSIAGAEDFRSHNWRWGYDDAAFPTDRSGGEDLPITVQIGGTGARNPVVRLRYVLVDTSGRGLTNASITLQYTTDSSWRTGVTEVGAQGSGTEKWVFRNSPYKAQLDTATSPALTTSHTPQLGKFIESAAEGTWSWPVSSGYYEMDFSLQYQGNETRTYYFRAVVNNDPVNFVSSHSNQGPRINTVATSTAYSTIKGYNWRWGYDNGASPGDRSGADDTPITITWGGSGTLNPITRLRYVMRDPNGNGVSNTSFGIQYTKDPTWQSDISEVGAADSSGLAWIYRASSHVTQLGTTASPMLNSAHSPSAGKTIEEGALNGLNHPADTGYYEYDMSLQYVGDETATYYFRPLVNDLPITFDASHATQGPRVSTLAVPKWINANWRWVSDDAAATDRSRADDNPVTVRSGGTGLYNPIVRLRHVLVDTAGVGVTNASITYQYTTSPNWSTDIHEVGAPGSTSEKWRFRNSSHLTQLSAVSTPLRCARNSPSAGKTLEEASANGFTYPASQAYWEMDTSLEYLADETTTYYFRTVINGYPASFVEEDGTQGATIFTELSSAEHDPGQEILPHGGFTASTNKCVNCHRPHNAPGFRLLFARPGNYDTIAGFCFACHKDGVGANGDVYYGVFRGFFTGSPGEGDLPNSSGWGTQGAGLNGGGFYYAMQYTNTYDRMAPTDAYGEPDPQPITSRHDAMGGPNEVKTVWGSDPGPGSQIGLQCISCHIPHGSTNYRLLRDKLTPTGGQEFPLATVKSHETQFGGSLTKSYTRIAYKTGLVRFCTSCHLHYATTVGTTRSTTEAYDAGDGWGSRVRHRHNEDVPLSNWTWWAENNAGYMNGAIATNLNDPDHYKVPLEQTTYSTSYSQDNKIVCLTCHQAHGTMAPMSDEDRIGPAATDAWSGPAFSFLQRLPNRAMCENCHDWWHNLSTGGEE